MALLHLLNVFIFYFQTKLNFQNPLLPKYLAYEIFEPYAIKGIILTLGITTVTILKFFKLNLIIILICVLLIVLYYFTSFEPKFVEYQ